MRKNGLLVLFVALLTFSMVFTACDEDFDGDGFFGGGGGGGGSGGEVNLIGTWEASMTRSQLAQIAVSEGEFSSVSEAEMFFSFLGIPSTFPAVRLVFSANNVREYGYDIKDGTWDFEGQGTYVRSGNNVIVTIGGQTDTLTISGNTLRWPDPDSGITLIFNKR